MFLFRVPSFAVGNCFFFPRGDNCTEPYYFSILFILPWIQSNDCLFVCLLCFSVYLLCHISHGQYSLSIQAASCVAVAFARGRCRDSVVLNVAFSTVLPFCAWLKSLCALLLHQRQRQECFFCSREYTWINTSRKALEGFWKKLIYISVYLYSFFITCLEISETGKINSRLFSVWLCFK